MARSRPGEGPVSAAEFAQMPERIAEHFEDVRELVERELQEEEA